MTGAGRGADAAAPALTAAARLLATAGDRIDPAVVRTAVVSEACAGLGAQNAVLVAADTRARQATVLAETAPAGTPGRTVDLDLLAPVAALVDRRGRHARLERADAPALAPLVGTQNVPGSALALALPDASGPAHVLVLLASADAPFGGAALEAAAAFAQAAAAALARVRLSEEHALRVAQRAALTRVAALLAEPLDFFHLLTEICRETAGILAADVAVVHRGDDREGLAVEAVHGLPPETIGFRLDSGEGLAGRAVRFDRPLLSNDYGRVARPPADSPFAGIRSALAVPLRWDGAVRGALAAGYTRDRFVSQDDLALLESLSALAAAACRTAAQHEGLARAARSDALTGLLNHAALHEGLAREIERAERSGDALSLVIVDLDDFKQVNERHGHLVGDELLRRVGWALRQVTRPYDLAARYGGDEFALVAVEADEAAALDIAQRALDAVRGAIVDVGAAGPGAATAGVAEWAPGLTGTELIARADRVLLYGKQENRKGFALAFSALPVPFQSGRFRRPRRGRPAPPPPAAPGAGWPDSARAEAERLRRRTRQLALATGLGTRLAALTAPADVLAAAAEGLVRELGFRRSAFVRLREDGWLETAAGAGGAMDRLRDQGFTLPRDAGLIGRCLRERRPIAVGDVRREPEYVATALTLDTRSELCVPVWLGERLWGALNLEDPELAAFDDDDALLAQTVADQVGSALRSALLYEQLERAHLGTVEALAAALEPRAAGEPDARPLVTLAAAVGERLDMTPAALRDLRFGALFHDIGRIAVPESILSKRGPLTPDERAEMARHAVVGEQILAPVDFLAGVRGLVRHEHERWDGRGYPDGLREEAIPLGARIIGAVDAFLAMTSERPYRPPLREEEARAELQRNAGSQFDPRVVSALLAVLDERRRPAAASPS